MLIALMAVANLAAALAPGFTVVLAARLLVGVSVGGLWAVASAKSAADGPPSARSASSASSHWPPRSCCCPRCRRPATSPSPSSSAAPREPRGPRQCDRHLPGGSGQLAAYTFVRPVLQDVSGVAAHHVCRLLLGYGVAAVAGNFPARPRDARRTLLVVSASLAVILARGRPPGAVAGTVLLLARGLAHGGASVSLQGWMIMSAPACTEAASSLMVAMFNLVITAGALLGGLAVDGISAPAAPLSGAALVLLAAAAVGGTSGRRRDGIPN
ncbi:hypothetical protein [Streptomyces sp. NPDC058612]|uniref:hypothetical protein n=1 Tax=Streptomyces sp. NPDC058612 TaxID=3346555 RepID=UPI00365F6CA4